MNDNFKKQPHHLIYEELLQQGITLGITTRGDGLSDYPKNALIWRDILMIAHIILLNINCN